MVINMCDHCEWEEALAEIESALDDLGDLPDRAEDFVDSVYDTLNSIQDWIIDNSHATDAQIGAIANIRSGIEAWR